MNAIKGSLLQLLAPRTAPSHGASSPMTGRSPPPDFDSPGLGSANPEGAYSIGLRRMPRSPHEPAGTLPTGSGEARLEESPVVLTAYRLFVSLQLIVLGVVKAVVSYEGHAIASTTLDLVLCLLGIITMYWLSPLEAMRPKVIRWMFHTDLLCAARDRARSRQPTIEEQADALGDPSVQRARLAITPHRVLGSLLILSFGIAKAVLGYGGNALSGTTLDWILGVFLSLLLYWVGLFEWTRPGVAPWFFHLDIISGQERVPDLDPKEYVDHYENIGLDEFPRFSVKVTGYRILNTTVVLGLGMAKSTLSYMGWTFIPVTFDWLIGVVAALVLYWTGFYEAPQTRAPPWFFQTDYSEHIRIESAWPNLFIITVGLLIAIGHLSFTGRFLSFLLTQLPTDNTVDTTCRIIIYIWFGLALIGIIRWLVSEGDFPDWEIIVFGVVGVYILSFLLVVFLSIIKQNLGYRERQHPKLEPTL
ncbi:hypothetical protein DL93DRAFT_2165030 [Clavulina sp. PMI_390]|nr:hypothetical protein DL93DRAFT_2165030 [Clavulina sp. PMI_390]